MAIPPYVLSTPVRYEHFRWLPQTRHPGSHPKTFGERDVLVLLATFVATVVAISGST